MKRFSLLQWTTVGAELFFAIVIVLIGFLTYFLYREYYQSISLTKRVVTLAGEVTAVEIDTARATRVERWFTAHRALPAIDPSKVSNPFK